METELEKAMKPVVDELTAGAKQEKAKAVTEQTIIGALRARYRPPEWAFLDHVANGTGSQKSRELDAIAMNLWPSRGLELVGFEVKLYRGDWLRELADPKKGEEGLGVCDSIFVVAVKGVVEEHELPASWGWIEANVAGGVTLRTRRPAVPRLPRREELPRSLVAAIMRAAERVAPEAQVKAAAERAWERGIDKGREIEAKANSRAAESLAELSRKVEAFEQAAGLRVAIGWTPHDPAKVGRAVREVLDGRHAQALARLEGMKQELERLAAGIGKVIEERQAEGAPAGADSQRGGER